MVDLPEPERPVSHTVAPLCPFSFSRSSRLTAPWCQTMFVAFCCAIGARALARAAPGGKGARDDRALRQDAARADAPLADETARSRARRGILGERGAGDLRAIGVEIAGERRIVAAGAGWNQVARHDVTCAHADLEGAAERRVRLPARRPRSTASDGPLVLQGEAAGLPQRVAEPHHAAHVLAVILPRHDRTVADRA